MMTEQFIFTAGDALDRIERVGGYKAHPLGKGHGTEVFSEHIPPDVVFYVDSAKESPGFEFIFVLEGELSYLGSDPHRRVRRGDYIAQYLIEERSYFKTITEVMLLHVCSPTAFHLVLEELQKNAGSQFDVQVVEALRQTIEQRGHSIAKSHAASVPSQAVPLGHRSAFSMIAEHILSGDVCEQVLDNVATAITNTKLFAKAGLLLFDRPYGGEAGRSIRINRAGFSSRERAEMPASIEEPLRPEDAKGLFDKALRVGHSYILQQADLPDAISRLFAMDSAASRSSGNDCFLVTPLRVGATKIIGLIIASARSGTSNLTQDVLSWSDSVAELVSASVLEDSEKRKLRSRVEKLSQLAIRDPLTHLYNRRFLDEVVKREEARARRSGKPISLLMIDLVAFREVNNRFGHVVGDRVLKKAGAVMEKQLRKTDTIFRYGGDEFLVVMPEATQQQANEIASRITQAIDTCDFGLSLAVSLKTGIASWDPKAPVGFSTALERADRGLYQDASFCKIKES